MTKAISYTLALIATAITLAVAAPAKALTHEQCYMAATIAKWSGWLPASGDEKIRLERLQKKHWINLPAEYAEASEQVRARAFEIIFDQTFSASQQEAINRGCGVS